MPYYVRLGVRGQILRFGAWVTVALGALVYWSAALRRRRVAPGPRLLPLPGDVPPGSGRRAA